MPNTLLIPTFTAAVNTWQCDENAHLNVQFYTEFAHEASAHLMVALGLGPRAQAANRLAIRASDDHIRYLREFRVVDAVEVRSAPVEVGDCHLVAYHEVRNPADSSLASTILRRLVSDRPWPEAFRAHAEAAKVSLPDNAKARSVGTPALPDVKLADAAGIGLIQVGRTVVKPQECDERGLFLPRHLFARYSDAAPMLWNHLGFDRTAMQERQEGTVVVETLHSYRAPLRAGDLLVVMSGLADFSDKTLKFAHFAFEAESGMLAACCEGVAMKFDQKRREIIAFSAEDRARLAKLRLRLFA